MLIARGGNPTLVITANGIVNFPLPQVNPVDTVGAEGAFADAFTVGCAIGMPLEEAIHFANAVGTLATQGTGWRAWIVRKRTEGSRARVWNSRPK